MKTLQQILVCALLAAAITAAVYTILLLDAARTTIAAVPLEIARTRSEVLAEVAAARHDLTTQIAASRQDLLIRTERQVAALRTDTFAELGSFRQITDRRWGDTLGRVDTAVARIDAIRGDLQPVLSNASALTADVQSSIDDLYWDVKASIESATVAADNVGQMSLDIRSATPRLVTDWDRIGTNIESITGHVERLTRPHWYDRLLGYGLNGVILYRNLNPATNLTVRGAQAIAGRP